MQDKYFSKIKMVCGPLWLIAALKAKNFPPKAFCGSRKLLYGKTRRTGIPSLMYHGVTPAISMGGKTNHFSSRHSMKKRAPRVRVTWSDRLQHAPDLMQTCSLFLAVINVCGNRLVLQTQHIKPRWLATVTRKITHHQHIREIHQHTGWKALCSHSG